MANEEQLEILLQGVEVWNKWKRETDTSYIDLREAHLYQADLHWADLHWADLRWADLRWADLRWADLHGTNLREVDLRGAHLYQADLRWADLREAHLYQADLTAANLAEADLRKAGLYQAHLQRAHLQRADLRWVNLYNADLTGADLADADLDGADLTEADLADASLHEADLTRADLVDTIFERADLTDCRIYGISAWNLRLKDAKQKNLVITPTNEPRITVDSLEVAQFIYLLLHNEKIRDVIDTIARKAVLILGRFSPPERKAVLDALRCELRNRGYLPIVFDFEKPSTKDFTETLRILAGMSLFVIVDMTNPKSSPLEMQATIPDYMTPFVPIIKEGEEPFSMFKDLHIMYKQWVLEPLKYDSVEGLIAVLDKAIIEPALEVHDRLLAEKAAKMSYRYTKDYR
jgi:uncharacterized protein YjbI with pentapeptide repeats